MSDTVVGGGWVGTWGQVKHAIRTMGGKFDEDGNPVLSGGVARFLNMSDDRAETVVGSDAKYLVDGQWASLPALLDATSYGVRNVTVFLG